MDDHKQKIAEAIAEFTELAAADLLTMIEPCKRPEHGDLAFPCFQLAKSLKKAPPLIAKDLEEKLQGRGLGTIAAVGPFLNFKLDETELASRVLSAVITAAQYGSSADGAGQTIVIDYSSPNIAKPFGIGHLRSTIIGHALKKLHESQGYKVVGINHLGDWGTQFGLMMEGWTSYKDDAGFTVNREDPSVESDLYPLYVWVNKAAKADPAVKDAGRAWFKKLEDGDPVATELWNTFKDISLKEFKRIYALLGVDFESWDGESFYNDKMEAVIARLEAKGLPEESEGALVIDFDKHESREWLESKGLGAALVTELTASPFSKDAMLDKMVDKGLAKVGRDELAKELERYVDGLGTVLLRRADGATLYMTRDLAAAYYRAETYAPSKVLYVVGNPQRQHFQQLFKVLELMGEPFARRFEHVGFGHYHGLSTRTGTLVFLNEVLERTAAMAKEIASGLRTREQIELSAEEIEDVAAAVGIGAVLFFDFHSRRTKDLEFDWDRVLNLKGDTGPYVQWTHARCCGILRKHAREVSTEVDFGLLGSDESRALFKTLDRFPEEIRRAIEQSEPSFIASYLIDLARDANAWIHVNDVIHSEDALRDARALVVEATRKVLAQGLGLLGIRALEKM